jgi:hypothetical protein
MRFEFRPRVHRPQRRTISRARLGEMVIRRKPSNVIQRHDSSARPSRPGSWRQMCLRPAWRYVLETLVSYWLTDLLHPTQKFDWRLEPSLSIAGQKRGCALVPPYFVQIYRVLSCTAHNRGRFPTVQATCHSNCFRRINAQTRSMNGL